MKIYKYPLSISEKNIIRCVKPISVIEQDWRLALYVLAGSEKDEQHDYVFTVVGTGDELTEQLQESSFLGSVKIGPYVWHIYYSEIGTEIGT